MGNGKIGGCMENGKACNAHGLWVALGNHLEQFMAKVSLKMVREGRFDIQGNFLAEGVKTRVHISG